MARWPSRGAAEPSPFEQHIAALIGPPPKRPKRREPRPPWAYPAPLRLPEGPDVRVGISGWSYPSWRGVFYPKGLPQKKELSYAGRSFASAEVNGTFYGLQRPAAFLDWYEAVPENFLFAVKGSRYLTHMLKLKEPAVPLGNFLASGVLALRGKLGPILWQLPPQLRYDRSRLEPFLDLLPADTDAAFRLASRHDQRLDGRSWLEEQPCRPMRHAIEVRHESFVVPEFLDLLRERGVAIVLADTAGKWPMIVERTAPFVYVRLHGDEVLYASGYRDAALDRWAALLGGWRAEGADLYVYFDNDIGVHAPFDALRLAERLGVRREVEGG